MSGKRLTFRPFRVVLTVFSVLAVTAGVALAFVYAAADREAARRSVIRPVRPSVLLEDRRGEYLAEIIGPAGPGWWDVGKEIPPRIVQTLLAAEDRNFYRHDGFDWKAAARSAWIDWKSRKRLTGASTLAMQIVRLSHPATRNIWNKAVEALAARKLTARLGREGILRIWLRIAPFGGSFHGIAYAARKYFDKPVTDLTLAETALLAAIPQSPSRSDLYLPSGRERAAARAKEILGRMEKNGAVTPREKDLAVEELGRIRVLAPSVVPPEAMHAVELLRRTFADSEEPIVRTSLDLELQKKAAGYLRHFVETRRSSGVGNAALVAADVRTGEVLAYVGSADYFDGDYSGSIDFAAAPRSSGSTLKPFLYALGMAEKGFTGATVLEDVGMRYESSGSDYIPVDSDRAYLGPVLYRYALANSRNIPAVQVLNEIGIRRAYDFFSTLGLVDGSEPPEYYGLGLAVGGLPVRLSDLVRAYVALGNDGMLREWSWTAGKASQYPARRVLPGDAARMICVYLSDPMARLPAFPRGSALEYPFGVAVKTGTSEGYRDAWAVACSQRYAVGAWTGDPKDRKMAGISGINGPAYLVRKVIADLEPEEMSGRVATPFLPPAGYVARQIDKLNGKLAVAFTPDSVTEYFRPGSEPKEDSDAFRIVRIDRRTGFEADSGCPEGYLESKVVFHLDPRYSEWARQAGLTPDPGCSQGISDADAPAQIEVTEPRENGRYLLSPYIPENLQTIALRARVEPCAPEAVWYVDGRPYQAAVYPYTVRWKLQPGAHTFELRLAYSREASRPVRIVVD
jgi:penicillin-binding protein 1C